MEWLTKILDEDEQQVMARLEAGRTPIKVYVGPMLLTRLWPMMDWLLADIAAKRAIVTNYHYLVEGTGPLSEELSGQLKAYGWAVAYLASAYADRPGYRESWRP